MRIGEAARRSGLEPSAIRFYETSGVLPLPARTRSGYRDYDEDGVDLLRFVHRLRVLQLPLDDIREIVALRAEGEAPCRPVRDAMAREAANIDARIEQLQQLRSDLDRLQAAASRITDAWPHSCVCHVIEGSTPANTS